MSSSGKDTVIDTNYAFKRLLLTLIDAHTQITALRLAVEDQGILTAVVKSSAMECTLEIWGPRALERIRTLIRCGRLSVLDRL
jgi:hypothetical protein